MLRPADSFALAGMRGKCEALEAKGAVNFRGSSLLTRECAPHEPGTLPHAFVQL